MRSSVTRAVPFGLAALAVLAASAPPPEAEREVENLAAFTRLYGVVRYFYPADAAATLDWDRFAVLGVRRARGAKDAAALQATLKELFAPLGPGIEIGKRLPPTPPEGPVDPALVAWQYRGPGILPPSAGGWTRDPGSRRAVSRTPKGARTAEGMA
jgi:hypothetical protein